jgi:hypothetical protein
VLRNYRILYTSKGQNSLKKMNMRDMGCALSIHQKECRKSLGCALYIGARYLPENTVTINISFQQHSNLTLPGKLFKNTLFSFKMSLQAK